jgi:hypothetical protein
VTTYSPMFAKDLGIRLCEQQYAEGDLDRAFDALSKHAQILCARLAAIEQAIREVAEAEREAEGTLTKRVVEATNRLLEFVK